MRALLLLLVAACGETPIANDSGADVATEAQVDASADIADVVAETDAQKPTGTIIRIMSANITSGTQQSYEDPGIRIFQGLLPDVVLIQEFDYQTGGPSALVAKAFGASFSYFVEPSVNIPNGIVSRFPILSSGAWVDASVTDRGFAWALIDLPGPIDLFAVSLHLLTTGVTERDTEAKQVVSLVQQNAPQGVYLVIGGDLNTDATNEAAITDLGALVVTAAPYPTDQNGNTNTSTNRNRPHDWVLADPTLQAHAVATWVGNSMYVPGLVFDSRVYTPLSEVAPVLASDSATAGMQHMAVVRDFAF